MSDLISRKALIQEIEPMLTWELLAKINKMPAVGAVPVANGRRIKYYAGIPYQPWHCSVCGLRAYYIHQHAVREVYLCPCCGAIMDLE